MIVLDTTVLVYAVGEPHRLADPCRRIIDGVGSGRVQATTTPEAIQEFVHVRAKRRKRKDAASLGRAYAELLSPLLVVDSEILTAGLRIFERSAKTGSFDAVLASVAMKAGAEALVSADSAFADIPSLTWWDPAGSELAALLS